MDRNLELLKRAKMYMEMLAAGKDPISGTTLPNDTVLNTDRLNRCFSFVSDILEQLIAKGGIAALSDANTEAAVSEKIELQPLVLSNEQKEKIPTSTKPLDVSAFTRNINKTVDTKKMKKLSGASFSAWLLKKGFIEKIGTQRKPTASGLAIGITLHTKQTAQLLYTQEAQQFLLDNIDEIITISNSSN